MAQVLLTHDDLRNRRRYLNAKATLGALLRQRALRLFFESLSRFGVLGIDRELAPGDAHAGAYQPLLGALPWYRRVG